MDGIPSSADQFRKLFDRTYSNIHAAPLPLKALSQIEATVPFMSPPPPAGHEQGTTVTRKSPPRDLAHIANAALA